MPAMPDLSLLPALDALLTEASVTRAAERTAVTPPAMSRTLARLRRQLGDELLVPSGRGLTPTPFAEALRPRVTAALETALAALRPPAPSALADLVATVSLRCGEAIAAPLMPGLYERAAASLPGLTLRVLPEGDEDPADLRRSVDLDIGVMSGLPPDVRVQHLFTDRVVLAVRAGHPLTRGRVTPKRVAAVEQIVISRRGRTRGVIDDRLAELGLARRVRMVTTSHAAATAVAATSDVAAVIARRVALALAPRLDLRLVELPMQLPGVPIELAWHARLDADPAARWVRDSIRELLAEPAEASRIA